MTDLSILFLGIFVSSIIASAVGLLLWGASEERINDEREAIIRSRRSETRLPAARRAPVAVPVRSRPAKHFDDRWDRFN